jgi:Flp pilus assembly protein TadB
MTSSLRAHHHHRLDTRTSPRLPDLHHQSRHATRHASHVLRRRVIGVIAVLVLSVVAVVLLDAAGFNPRVAAASIGILACNVFASWSLITQASHGSRRRVPRARPPR